MLVGGGAEVNWTSPVRPASFLYASRPGAGQSWFVAAKDHLVSYPVTVTAYAIGVSEAFLNHSGLKVVRFRSSTPISARKPSLICGPEEQLPAVLVSGGTEIEWKGMGSLMKASAPNLAPIPANWAHPFSWIGSGSDFSVPDPSPISTWAIALVAYP